MVLPTSFLLLVGGLVFFASYRLFRWMSHFRRLDLLYEKPLPIFGNMTACLFRRVFMADHLHRLYKKFSRAKYFGFFDFWTPVVIVRDPQLITAIAIKNFDCFCDHRGFADEQLDPLFGGNLFSLRGDRWREMRRLLSPAFTASKMKTMHGLVCECADTFVSRLFEDGVKLGRPRDVDAKEAICRYTNDVVASTAFGIKLDSMRDRNNDFYRLGRKALNFDSSLSLKFILASKFPWFMKLFGIRLFSEEVRRFFESLVEKQTKMRLEQGVRRPDLIQLMMETRSFSNGVPKKLTVEEMTAQAFVFFFAGFDSTATALCFVLHEIALNPQVQEKLRAEIQATLKRTDGMPSYDSINQMRYLDAVINEANRKYPLPSFLDRLCVKEFELPPATHHSADGSAVKPLKLSPGDVVWFPVYSIHRDPLYYPEPEKFHPDRFLGKQPDPSVYLTFGIGPRFCIGNRFALMESKILIFYLLARCALEPAAKTTVPMEYCTKSFQIRPKSGFWIRLKNLENPLLPPTIDA